MKLANRLDKTIRHECGHAIGLLITGHDVAEVRVDHELVGQLGRVEIDHTHSSADYYGCLIAVLMGPMSAGDPPPVWPLDPHSSGDERALAVLVDYLALDRGGYQAAIDSAALWLDWHEAKGAMALLGQALARVPVITGDQLRELLGPRLARLQHAEEVGSAA
jgi:hypothetical protein